LGAINFSAKTSAVDKQSRSKIAVDKVGECLRQIVAKYPEIYNQPVQCEALLRDFCPGHSREIFILMSALKSRIVTDLLSYNNSVLGNVQKDNLFDRLQSECGFSDKDARWGVKSWDMALRNIGPEIQDLQESDFQSTDKLDDSIKSSDPSTHNKPSLLTNGISRVGESESGKDDKDHAVHSYFPPSNSSWKKILIIVPLAIVGAVIGFGMLAGPWNPGSNDDNAGGGGEASIITTPAPAPAPATTSDINTQSSVERMTDDSRTDGLTNKTMGSTADVKGSISAANNDDWPIVLEWEVI
jgi:hypothetical protein